MRRFSATSVSGAAATGGGFAVHFGGRLLFLFVAARGYGAPLLGAYSLALATNEAGVLAGGLESRLLLFQWLDASGAQSARHVVGDALVLVGLAATVVSAVILAVLLLLPDGTLAAGSRAALLLMAPTIVLQVWIELLLAATRWTQVLRWEIVAKNLVQPYASLVIAAAAAATAWSASGCPCPTSWARSSRSAMPRPG